MTFAFDLLISEVIEDFLSKMFQCELFIQQQDSDSDIATALSYSYSILNIAH